MTATATKPRKHKNKPAGTVLEARPPMPSYESLVEETGINPDAVCAEYDRLREDAVWQPWSLRGAWEVITGRADWTAWTVGDAQWEPVEQCPNPATHYVELYQEGVHHGVTHLNNLCALHEELVRRMPGWVWSQHKQVVPA